MFTIKLTLIEIKYFLQTKEGCTDLIARKTNSTVF